MQLSTDKLKFALDDDERASLDLMMRQPGYKVLQRIMLSYVEAMKAGAQNVAMAGGTDEAVVQAWRNARIGEQMRLGFEAGVKFELDILRRRKQDRPDEETLAAQRRTKFTLEAV